VCVGGHQIQISAEPEVPQMWFWRTALDDDIAEKMDAQRVEAVLQHEYSDAEENHNIVFVGTVVDVIADVSQNHETVSDALPVVFFLIEAFGTQKVVIQVIHFFFYFILFFF